MDAFLISCAIRVAGVFQKRGIPLPSIISFCMAGYLAIIGLITCLYAFLIHMLFPAAFFALILVRVWLDSRGPLRQLALDATMWGPRLFDRYRESAGKAVLTESGYRLMVLAFWGLSVVCVQPMFYLGHPVVTFGALMIAFFPLAKLMELLVRCVPPMEAERRPRMAADAA